eukprot:CAMPEP_0197831804 /NCGR_PEP_ID=MMETSP1437-20131217/12193_1 /TAXON_ID=49252 ORGANISM="Eucampia antarctica, Strain CCMP1452" /NCGR_SAMPLE_ID=MMETSP1437 /ASSEMBLY_ACC=CAM_ASM_001096 /LENGTH=116 /DNA_ID=CAMNT_0043434877 /DNA_START=146 /DNA_END=493 /DNA_ORIENTATION=+
MIDPMANLSKGNGSSAIGDMTGGEGQDVFDMAAAQANITKTDKIRSFMGIISGCVAGILGLTGLEGLACFVVLHFVVSLSILSKMEFNLKAYSRDSLFGFFTGDLQPFALSFMLFW